MDHLMDVWRPQVQSESQRCYKQSLKITTMHAHTKGSASSSKVTQAGTKPSPDTPASHGYAFLSVEQQTNPQCSSFHARNGGCHEYGLFLSCTLYAKGDSCRTERVFLAATELVSRRRRFFVSVSWPMSGIICTASWPLA